MLEHQEAQGNRPTNRITKFLLRRLGSSARSTEKTFAKPYAELAVPLPESSTLADEHSRPSEVVDQPETTPAMSDLPLTLAAEPEPVAQPSSEPSTAAEVKELHALSETEQSNAVTPEPGPVGIPRVALDVLGDRAQTEKRYREASQELSRALELPRNKWGSFIIPTLGELSETNPLPQLREFILKTLETREERANSKGLWSGCKRVVERAFTASSPFAKNFLTVASHAQSVCAPEDDTELRFLLRTHMSYWRVAYCCLLWFS